MSNFQWIINNAAELSIDNKPLISQTTSRNGVVRTVSRGAMPWKFTVTMPEGIPWTSIRKDIALAESLNRVTPADIQLSDTGHDWIVKYQGDHPAPTTMQFTWTYRENTVTVTHGTGTYTGFKFRAGDFIQLGTSGKVYQVTTDVPSTATSFTVHRPVLEQSGTAAAIVGANCKWNVICTSFPQWNLFARDQVNWSGAFVFTEVI